MQGRVRHTVRYRARVRSSWIPSSHWVNRRSSLARGPRKYPPSPPRPLLRRHRCRSPGSAPSRPISHQSRLPHDQSATAITRILVPHAQVVCRFRASASYPFAASLYPACLAHALPSLALPRQDCLPTPCLIMPMPPSWHSASSALPGRKATEGLLQPSKCTLWAQRCRPSAPARAPVAITQRSTSHEITVGTCRRISNIEKAARSESRAARRRLSKEHIVPSPHKMIARPLPLQPALSSGQ